MKKAVCICLIVAAALFVAGILCMVVGIVRYGGLPPFGSTEMTEVSETFPADTKEIRTELRINGIVVRRGGGENISLRYHDRKDSPLNLTCSDGVVSLTDPHHRFFSFPWDWFLTEQEEKRTVTVEIPEDFCGDLTLVTETGKIEVSGAELGTRKLTAKATTGDVKLSDCSFASVQIRTTTGGVEVRNLTVGTADGADGSFSVATETGGQKYQSVRAGKTALDASTGDITAENLICDSLRSTTSTGGQEFLQTQVSGNAEIRSTTGNIETETLTVGSSLRVTSTTGSMDLTGIRAGGELYLEASTGDIKGTLRGTADYYAKDCTTGTGNIRLPEFAAGGTIPLSVRTTTGNVRLLAAD